jgi:hypothetical protein
VGRRALGGLVILDTPSRAGARDLAGLHVAGRPRNICETPPIILQIHTFFDRDE